VNSPQDARLLGQRQVKQRVQADDGIERLRRELHRARIRPDEAGGRNKTPGALNLHIADVDAGHLKPCSGKRPGNRNTAATAKVENRAGWRQTAPQISQPRRVTTVGRVIFSVQVRQRVIAQPDEISLRVRCHGRHPTSALMPRPWK
jgi:hypothetical protein